LKNLTEDLSGSRLGKQNPGPPQIMLPNFNELAIMGQQQQQNFQNTFSINPKMPSVGQPASQIPQNPNFLSMNQGNTPGPQPLSPMSQGNANSTISTGLGKFENG